MRISVVTPVRNEEDSIRALLESLLNQTLMPAEIVITDAGSTDSTPEIIAEYARRGAPIRLIREAAAFPGRGRNLGTAQATSEWVAYTDAGILPAKNWLQALAARVESDSAVDVVYGSYEPITNTFFRECAAISYVPPAIEIEGERIRPRSVVSVLMRRSVWQAVGGFPEDLRSAEDLLFLNKVEASKFRIGYAPRAVVLWTIQPTLWRTFRRFVTYSHNNIRAELWSEWQASLFRRYSFLLLLTLPAFFAGRWWLLLPVATWLLMLFTRATVAIWRNRRCYPASLGRQLLRLLVLVPLIAVIDSAAIIGSMQWLVKDRTYFVNETAGVSDGN